MSTETFFLKDKSVLITGALTGIGRATAILLAEMGASVLATGRDCKVGAELEKEQTVLGHKLFFFDMDVTKSDQVEKAVHFAEKEFGRVDALVNNAAICVTGKRLEDLSDKEWNATLDINVGGVFRVCRAGLPALRRAGGGSVVNIASVHA